MPGCPPAIEFPTLLRLLDDDTPEVRRSVAEALSCFDGDVSESLTDAGPRPDHAGLELLSELLRPSRRRRLRREWIVPSAGLAALHEDWDHCECLMRAVSDFLHDGVTLRQPLGDSLDLLAEEATGPFSRGGPTALVRHLLDPARLPCDADADPDPGHFDLAAVAGGQPSNPVGCGLVVLLVARRLGAAVSAINDPEGLLLVSADDRGGLVHDPAAAGGEIGHGEFIRRIRRYPDEVRQLCSRPASPAELLLRLVEELATCFAVNGLDEDALLAEELVASLQDGG